MIEDKLERIASALEALSRHVTAALPEKRGPGRPPKTATPPPPPPPEPDIDLKDAELPPEPEDDTFLEDDTPAQVVKPLAIEDVRRALVDYRKRVQSEDKARAILKQHGQADTLKSLKPERYKAVYDAAMAG